MAVLRKILQKQDLSSIETYVNDTTFNSKYFNVLSVEDTIPGGKSSFQILGSKYLTPDVELRVELLDKNGNPVFTEAIKYLGDKPSRHISIEVYENTPAGIGTLTILGSAEFLSDGSSIPEEWRNLYNVKWERDVYIDSREKNTQPILFQGQAAGFKEFDRYQLPTLEISEKVRGVIVPSGSKGTPTGFVTQSLFTGGNYEANASAFGKPTDVKDASTQDVYGNPFPKPNSPIIPSITSYGQKPKNQAVDSPTEAFTNSDVIYESIHGIGNGLLTPPEILHPSDPLPPEEPNFTGQGTLIKKTTGDPFRAEFEGGIFKAVPSVNHNLVSNITGKTYTSSSFTASIIAVHSPDLLEIDRPFTIQNQKEYPEKNFKVPHKATSFTIDFEPAGQTHNSGSGESTIVYRSFAEVTIKNMKTFSGDVHRVKTFTKGFSEAGDFSLIADRLVEASDILNDRNTPTLRQKTGVFQNQSHLDKNWKLTRLIKGKNVTSISTSGSLSFTSTSTPAFMNGVIISGSNGMVDESIVFETKTSDLRVRPDVDYELKLRAILKVGEKDILQSDGTTLQQAKGKVRFYLSGSKIEQDLKGIELGGAKNSFGDPVRFNVVKDEKFGSVVALQSNDSNNSVGKLIDFGIVRIPFKPNFENDVVVNDDTKLQVEVESGQLYLQRVELLPATETNFSPDEFTFVAPMPKLRTRPDIFDFKVEFYDRNANKAEYVSLREAVTFEGENEVIQGTDNLLTGSLYIGNSILSGIEAGGVNSAYIRSVGYAGFESSSVSGQGGFAIWSGSVSRSLNTSESYEGVGIELHDGNSGSFKFRTKNADGVGEFDVRTDKFFFGKVGEQFVSGSDGNLEISSSGFHLQADGKVTASQIHIDGGVVTGSLVIGDSVTVNAATANQIRVPVGGPPFKAVILQDGYARFTTGSIASFTIDSNAISTTGSNSFYISGSAEGIPTQDGRQNNFISASKFQVSADGNLTASNVLIDGGVITGDVNIQGTASANSIAVPADGPPFTAEIKSDGYARFTTGSIASFTIDTNAISTTGSDRFYISGSAAGIPTQDGAQNLFISSSKFQVSAKGDVTGSNVLFEGGVVGGFELGPSIISSSNDALILKSSGQITGSKVLFTEGKIAEWNINGNNINSVGGGIRLNGNGNNAEISINSHTFGNEGIQIGYNSGNPRFYAGDGAQDFIKYDSSNGVNIKSAIFDLDATTLILDSATNSGTIRLGASGGPSSVSATTAGIYMDGTGDFQIYGDADNYFRFDISDKLEIKAETFDLATSTMLLDSGTNSGKIALGATPNTAYDGTNAGVYMDGTGKFSVYGDASNYIRFSGATVDIKTDEITIQTAGTNKLKLFADGTNTPTFAMGATLNTSVSGTNQGIYMDGTGDFLVFGDANNFLKIDGTTFTIKSEIFALDTTNLDIDSASKRITINDGSADRIHIGEVDGGTTYGMKIFDGTGTADSDILVEFGEGQNYIAGWTIGTDTISSNNLVLHSSGKIETSNFASGLRGWRIDSLQNGIAEFENARIRGTLSTTVFEKETINAVGGQLYVANSTMITSSTAHPQGTVSASNATMSVVNVTGFTGSYEGGPGHSGTGKGEILAIKKVTDTGFSTEYVQVISSSRLNPSSGTDLSGLLFVTRSYGGGISETGTGLSSSLGDPAFLKAQQYEPGQVVVSTGRHIGGTGATTTGSGFVRINANPNDLSTPYVDIVERTGSAIYDVDLKARLGDLSGLASQYVRGADVKGFGLVTSNVFLTSSFFVGGINEHISFQTGSFEAKLKKLNLSTGQGLTIQGEGSGSANKILLGLASNFSSGDGIFMDGGGDFRVGGESSNFIKFDASTGVLTVDGTINITGGGGINEAISGLQATATSSNAQSQSAADVDFASSGSQTRALAFASASNELSSTSSSFAASGSQTKALAFASESNARTDDSGSIVSSSLGAKINPYETQVVLSSGGMSLLKTEGQVLAEYNESVNLRAPGATTKNTASLDANGLTLVKGGVTASAFGSAVELMSGDNKNTASFDANGFIIVEGGVTQSKFATTTTIGMTTGSHMKMSGSGLELLNNTTTQFGVDSTGVNVGDPANEHVRITTSGLELKDGATTYGKFASTTTIGDTSTEHISISNTELRLKDGSTTRILMNSSGLTMGNHISINASGDASFSGTVTVGGTDLTTSNTLNANTTAGNVGLGNVDNTDSQGTAQAGLISGTTITGGGITLNGGGVIKTINKDSVSDTTAGFFLGHDGASSYDFAIGDANSFLKWDGSASSLNIKGSITITNPGDIDVSDLNNDSGFTDDTAASAAQSTANTANTAAGNAQSAVDTIEEKVVITGAAVQVQNSTADKTILDSGLVSIVQGNVTSSLFTSTNTEIRGGTLASKTTASFDKAGVRFIDAGVTQSLFGANLTQIGVTTGSHIQMSGSGLELLNGSTTRFGADSTGVNIGDPANEHVRITDSGVDLKDGATTFGRFASTITLSPDISSATTDAVVIAAGGVKIYDSSTDYLHMGSDGLKVYDGDASNPVAQFGATAYIGKEATEHIKITNTSLEIKDGSTVFGSFGATTKIGDANNEHVEINTSTIDVKDGSTTHASFGATSTIGSSTDKVTINSSGVTIREANVDTIQLANSTASFGNASAQHVQIVGDGVHLKKDANTRVGTFGKVIDVNDETTRGFTNVTSASVNIGRFATPTFNEVSIEGISASNAIFDRVFTSNINSSNLQSTGSISLFTSRSLSATTTSSVPFVVHDEVSSTDALIEPSFQFSTLYTAKGADAIGFPSVSSGSSTGIFDISTTITSDGQNATPFKGGSGGDGSQAFNVLGLRVINDTGDNTGGGRFQFKGAIDSQPYTFINAVDKTRVPPAFRNLGGIRFQVKNSGAIVSLGNITAFGNTSNFTTLSDIKYKKDITRISESLDRVLELKPSKFVWKTTDTEDIGFIAQEVEEVIPEVVLTDKEGIMGAPDTKDYKTITYPKLIPLLVDSIQELTKKVSTLEDKIKELEK